MFDQRGWFDSLSLLVSHILCVVLGTMYIHRGFVYSLSGLGVARQRKAIVQGLQSSVAEFSNEVKGTTTKDVMDILLLTQYFDTLAAVGANSLFLEHDPSAVAKLQSAVRTSFSGKN